MKTESSSRVIAWVLYYADNVPHTAVVDDAGKHIDYFKSLPDDGVQSWYLYKADGRREGHEGSQWYYIVVTPEGIVYDSDARMANPEEIQKRYPGAIVKRGKRVSNEHFERIRHDAFAYKFPWPCEDCE